MSRGEPDVKAIFTAALEVPAGPERDAYVDSACGGNTGLRRRIEDLLAALARASDVLGPAGPPAIVTAAEAPMDADEATGALELTRGDDPEATRALSHATGVDVMTDPALDTALGDPEATASPDDRGDGRADGDALPPGMAVRYFGDYEIRHELGRGGMGVVYEARQVSLNRPVALKMVKAGLLAGDDELRRFQNEAEAVALLDHPGVVPVYEVGQHNGQHYFSMKLVGGGSLVPLMGRYKDDPRAAARLVAGAAEAVAHAHARGILHRDLKPANILVDAEGHPHVTDFGLAKKVQADVEFTQSGAILGTPAYMSPEQATGHRGAVTTSSDVYGLGAVLYALLTGRAPFGGDSVVETLDAVRNALPEPPTRLNPTTPRDLETICLRCLEKDPRRRYPTAQALADDLRAWLDSRPIAARRVGAAERAWLWCRRRPAVAGLSAAVLLATIVGTITVIAVQAKANADLRAANRRVEQRYNLAVDAIKTFHTGVSEDFLLKQDQFKELRDHLLKSAADFYGKLGALLGKETDVASRGALAQANFELAELTEKVGDKEDALPMHRAVLAAREALAAEAGADDAAKVDVGRSLTAVAGLIDVTGHKDQAILAYRKAEEHLAHLADPSPAAAPARAALAACRAWLGWLLHDTGHSEESLAVLRLARLEQEVMAAAPGATAQARKELADTVRLIGAVLQNTGKVVEAETEIRTALAIYRKLADDQPANTDLRSNQALMQWHLAGALWARGKLTAAEAEFRAALALQQKLTDDNPAVTDFRSRLASFHRFLGMLLSEMGESAAAEAEYRAAIALCEKLAVDNPNLGGVTAMIRAWVRENLGSLLLQTGRPAAAEAEFRTALALSRKLADDHPADTDFRFSLSWSHQRLGLLLVQTGRPAAAEAEFRTALAIEQKLADDHPAATDFRSRLAGCHQSLSNLLQRTGKSAEAEAEYRAALAIEQKLADDNPAATDFRSRLAESHANLGWLLTQTGQPAAAEAEFRTALLLFRKLADDNPQDPRHRDAAANVDNNLSVALRRLGRSTEARVHCARAVAVREALVKEYPKSPDYRGGLAENYLNRGLTRRALGDPAGATADVRRALALFDALPWRSEDEWEYQRRFTFACAHAALAGLAGQAGSGVSAGEAVSQAETAMALLHKAVAMGYRNADTFRTESALDHLRGRPDFRRLLMDLAMPADPFAAPR